jgi:hypothetical protein
VRTTKSCPYGELHSFRSNGELIIFKTRLLTTVPKIRTIAEMFVVEVGRARKYDRPKEKRAENPSI